MESLTDIIKNSKNHFSKYDYITNLVHQCFNKRFNFAKDGNKWELPQDNVDLCNLTDKIINEKWQIRELEGLKVELNNVKSKLNCFNFADWHKHTRSRNPAGLIMEELRNRFTIELLTQAWCKFYELLNVYKIVPSDLSSEFNTFHLCEAPGAFICSLNHYLRVRSKNPQWQWFGNTLNPYHEGNCLDEMINDDRIIEKTLKNWWFGEDYTGNLRHKCNLEDLKKFTSTLRPIHLVTADGSIDCCKNPGNQEINVLPLHYSETIAALSILSPGGNFVIKIFTMYECETICLLYLLCCVFKNVSIHKPVVSKEGNSEVYVICLDYVGKEKCHGILDRADYYGQFPVVLFKREELPDSFIRQVIECSRFFTNTQISVLEKNISTYQSVLNRKQRILLWKLRNRIVDRFFQIVEIGHIDKYIVLGDNKLYIPLQLDLKNEDGSYEDRLESLHPDKYSLLLRYQRDLLSIKIIWEHGMIYWFPKKNKHNDTSAISIIRSSPVTILNSSKFCKGSLLKIVYDLHDYGLDDYLLKVNRSYLTKVIEDMSTWKSQYIICNVENKHWLKNYHLAQKECLNCLITCLENVKVLGSFVLIGLPLLTQFNVGLLYLLCSSFAEVGIVSPDVGYVITCKYRQVNFEILPKLREITDQLNSSEYGITSIAPSTLLLEGEFYSCITTFNHLMIKNSALQVIKTFFEDYWKAETADDEH